MRESTIEKQLVARVKNLGGRAWKWVSPANRGVPDRIVTLPGCPPFAVEVKAPGRRTTALQEHVIGELRKMGMTVFVVDSIEGVDSLLGCVTGTCSPR